MGLVIVPLDLAEANALVARWHRHHRPTRGHKFSVGVAVDGRICGAAIVGRPISRVCENCGEPEEKHENRYFMRGRCPNMYFKLAEESER